MTYDDGVTADTIDNLSIILASLLIVFPFDPSVGCTILILLHWGCLYIHSEFYHAWIFNNQDKEIALFLENKPDRFEVT